MQRRIIALLGLAVAASAGLLVALYLNGTVRFNHPSPSVYPLRGIDVSHHQGAIDWGQVAGAGYGFAYIKATEGKDFVDPRFRDNWAEAGKHLPARGAYHFFTFCSSGSAQAANFLSNAPPLAGTLPPAVDVEFVGNCKNWTSLDDVRRELRIFVDRIEAAHGRKPLIYVTADARKRVLAGQFSAYDLWYRDVFRTPALGGGRSWLIWQFADRGRVPGISGPVDLNVFSSSTTDLSFWTGTGVLLP